MSDRVPDQPYLTPREPSDFTHAAQAEERIEEIHNAYREALKAYIAVMKKYRIWPSKRDVEIVAQDIGEGLISSATGPLAVLKAQGFTDYSYSPDNTDEIINATYAELVNHLNQTKEG